MWKTKESKWKKLDNAAKIFPALSGREDAEVFRLTCQLKEEIVPELLQQAVDMAIEEYPSFTNVVRRGVFWYYLEETMMRPKIHEENQTPLRPLYKQGNRLLIDISYYRKRVNFEIFHALSDGTGAMVFFQTIIVYYLKLRHSELLGNVVIENYDHTERQVESDGFTQYYEPTQGNPTDFKEFLGKKQKNGKVYQFKERKTADYRQHLTEGSMSAAKIKAAAKALGATITEFICAVLILSIYDNMEPKDRKKKITIAIPVNLRNYFASSTLRNFFGMIHVTYDFSSSKEHTLESIIPAVREEFEKELTLENMQKKIASQVKMERHPIVRVCPLILKDLVVVLMQTESMKRRTIALSNVGKVSIQKEFADYIDSFGVFNSSSARQMCMSTFGDNMIINFAGVLAEHDVERSFYRRMAEFDENIIVSASYSPKEHE